MAVDDLWYLRTKGPDGKRLPSKRHGRGKRWRVRWVDPDTGRERTELFEKKVDADTHDANMHADISRGQYVNPAAGRMTVEQWAEQWRHQLLHRDSTVDRVERAIRRHIVPMLGSLPLSQVRASHIRAWVKDRHATLSAVTVRGIYQTVLAPMFTAAVVDRRIGLSPCIDIPLPAVDSAEFYIATPKEVHALAVALPSEYRAAVYLAAGCGWRAAEVMGLEVDGIDFLRREVHVRHQLKSVQGRPPLLAVTKTRNSKRTNELPQIVATALARHLEKHPVSPVRIIDETDEKKPIEREAHLLFLDHLGKPFARSTWSRFWRPAVKKAGLPEGFGLRDLRHYFATCLIFGGANVKTVQLAMGHSTPTTTLNTYVGLWPDAVDRTRTLVDTALGTAPRLRAGKTS